jgi:hypothetical protein
MKNIGQAIIANGRNAKDVVVTRMINGTAPQATLQSESRTGPEKACADARKNRIWIASKTTSNSMPNASANNKYARTSGFSMKRRATVKATRVKRGFNCRIRMGWGSRPQSRPAHARLASCDDFRPHCDDLNQHGGGSRCYKANSRRGI